MHEDEAGPPTQEDDWWHHEHVRAAGYPKVKKGDRPMEGQMTFEDKLMAAMVEPIQETIDSEALRNTRYADKGQHYPFAFGGTCTCGARHTQGEADALNT